VKTYLLGLMGLFLILSASAVFSASMWYDFGNNWATDGNASLNVYVDAGTDGTADNSKAVTVSVSIDSNECEYSDTTSLQSNGKYYANFNLDLNCDGVLDINGADLNFVISSTSPVLSKNFSFYLPGFKDVDMNWQDGKLISVYADENLTINPIFYDENGSALADFNGDFKLYLFGPDGNFVDSYDVNGLADYNFQYEGNYAIKVYYGGKEYSYNLTVVKSEASADSSADGTGAEGTAKKSTWWIWAIVVIGVIAVILIADVLHTLWTERPKKQGLSRK